MLEAPRKDELSAQIAGKWPPLLPSTCRPIRSSLLFAWMEDEVKVEAEKA